MMLRPGIRVWMRNKCYRLIFGRVPDDCRAIVDNMKKTIRVSKHVRGKAKLYVLIHESLHACHWDLTEEAVEQTGKSISELLWALGYREEKQNGPTRV